MVCNPRFCRVRHRVSLSSLRGGLIDIAIIGIGLMILALFLIGYSKRMRSLVKSEKKSYGVPEGRILYSDLNVPATALFSKRFRLSGKPDYIVQKHNRSIPVEVKSGGGSHPHQSQILQLAAYCQILEDTSGVFVPEGLLVYNNVPFRIPFDPKLRFELESIIKTMRSSLRTGEVQRNHQDPRRCKHCSMRRYCSEAIKESL